MKKLIQELAEYCGEELVEGLESYAGAKGLFEKGVMPDGSKWMGGKPKITTGFDGDVKISKAKQKDGKNGTIFDFELKLSPGKGGGAGATIAATASNQFFNLVGTDKKAIAGLSKAFTEAAKKATSEIGAGIHQWLSDPTNWVHMITGWDSRVKWNKPSSKIVSLKLGKPMVDPTRRKWPSGRTEIWIPLTAKIQAEARRK